MKNLLIRTLACILVLTMSFTFFACKNEDKKDNGNADTPADDQTNPEDWWKPVEDNKPSDDEICIHEDANEDLKCDLCGADVPKPWDPWDEVKYFAVPNSNVTISVLDIDTDGKIKNLTLANGSTIALEFDYTVAAASSFEMKFDTETVKVTFGADGKIAILKGETELASSSSTYTGAAKVVINYDGAKITVTVGDAEAVKADYVAPATNAALYLIAGTGSKFENTKAILGGSALEFETRHGTTWAVITEEGENKNAFHTGYVSKDTLNYRCQALINNIGFENSKKITISAKIAIGENGNEHGDRGFLLELWHKNGEGDSSPLFYENSNGALTSGFKVYLAAHGVSAAFGKFGATNFSDDAGYNRDGKWKTLPGAGVDEISSVVSGTNEKGEYIYQKENTFAVGEYIDLKAEWDRENFIMSYYYNGTLVQSVDFTRDIFVNDGSGIGIVTASGDVYFKDFVLIVE